MAIGTARETLAIPAGSGDYAPEVIYLELSQRTLDSVSELSVLIEDTLPASGEVVVEVLRAGGDRATAGDWIEAKSYTAGTLQDRLALAAWYGVRIRGKSGGTAGNVDVSVQWY